MKSRQKTASNLHLWPWYGSWGILVLLALCGTASYFSFFHLPPALTDGDLGRLPYAFNGARAWNTLVGLDALGPKPVGSVANEVGAVKLLEREFTLINATKHAVQEVLYEKQITSGAYCINFFGSSMTSVYRNVQNLIVRMAGQEGVDGALMLNCHFDSVASSPGASDDCGSCAVMLEILRVLSRGSERPRHPIVFLFNGAEETPLQASHGFITQHRWAKEIRAFLNLESVGSGGKELLFQSGPQHPWLVEAYARAVRHPFAHAIGEEIFQSGFIPSDTDFRIFRDFGHIPGLDFAHIFNGFRYHTRYDSVEYLLPAVLQNTGDNVLSLVRLITGGDYLERSVQERAVGKSVFFDFLGLFFVTWSEKEAAIMNVLVAILGLMVGYWATLRNVGSQHWRAVARESLLHGFCATLVGAGAAVGFNLVIAFLLDHFFQRSMAWFSTYTLTIGLYCLPTMVLLFIAHREFHRLFQRKETPLPLSLAVKTRLTGVYLFWSVIMIGATIAGLRSAYVISVLLACMVLVPLISEPYPWHLKSKIASIVLSGIWVFLHTVALLWTTQFFHIFANIFIPIAGRSGANDNPDLLIATVTAVCSLLVCSFMLPLVNLLRNPYRSIIGTLLALFLISVLLAIATPLGFPYRQATPQQLPKVQRILAQHTLRQWYDSKGTVRADDAGYLFRLWDRHNEATIREVIASNGGDAGSIYKPSQMGECATEVFCGFPASAVRFSSLWYAQPKSNHPEAVEMVKLSLESRNKTTAKDGSAVNSRLVFNLAGSYQSSILVRPRRNVTLVAWNLTPQLPRQLSVGDDHRAYYVLITHGLPGQPLQLILDLEQSATDASSAVQTPLVDISVTSNFWEYHEYFRPAFSKFIKSFPYWAHVVPSVSIVNLYSF
ncbi:endoplasmic reticulum metallopeptidase 1-like [Anopheles albimanus]|uniref:endoplasmic reticulum metallopeptidase 1-like n=1 Tax=Anopheles albimanus TaxID=7167 RepID=UPI001640CCD0|nr:endoplasmic reticulum metallopeptidase 1-like [Anopheles albimanus]